MSSRGRARPTARERRGLRRRMRRRIVRAWDVAFGAPKDELLKMMRRAADLGVAGADMFALGPRVARALGLPAIAAWRPLRLRAVPTHAAGLEDGHALS